MGLNQGQLYEQKIFSELKANQKIPKNISRIDQVDGQDITVFNSNGQSGIEIKSTSSAAFGSGTLKFDYRNSRNPWKLLTLEVDDEYGEKFPKGIMETAAKQYKILDKVNSEWFIKNGKYQPLYLEEDNPNKIKRILSIPKKDRGKRDSEALSEIKIDCDKSVIENYYSTKGSFYIQIKESGLFWLGKKDPLNISKIVSRFNPSKTFIRIRVQPKGNGKYNFSYGLYIKGLQKSSFDLDKDMNPSWLG